MGGVFCWIDRIWSSKECVHCVYDPSVHLYVPSMFVFVHVGSYLLIWEFESWNMVFINILCGQVRACSCYAFLPFGILCVSVIRMMFVKIRLAVCMLVGHCGPSEIGLLW